MTSSAANHGNWPGSDKLPLGAAAVATAPSRGPLDVDPPDTTRGINSSPVACFATDYSPSECNKSLAAALSGHARVLGGENGRRRAGAGSRRRRPRRRSRRRPKLRRTVGPDPGGAGLGAGRADRSAPKPCHSHARVTHPCAARNIKRADTHPGSTRPGVMPHPPRAALTYSRRASPRHAPPRPATPALSITNRVLQSADTARGSTDAHDGQSCPVRSSRITQQVGDRVFAT